MPEQGLLLRETEAKSKQLKLNFINYNRKKQGIKLKWNY
jgi:hypothetical protein